MVAEERDQRRVEIGEYGEHFPPPRDRWFTERMRAALGVAAVLVLAACGGGGGESEDPLEAAGCENPREVQTDELYVQTAYECASGPDRVLIFADNEARDSFVEIAQSFGFEYEVGDGWAAEQG
jgi:hypothetical protein